MQTSVTDYQEFLKNVKGLSDRTIENYMDYFKRFIAYPTLNQESVNAFISFKNNNNVVSRSFIKTLIKYYKFYPAKAQEEGINVSEIIQIEIEVPSGRKEQKLIEVPLFNDIMKACDSMKEDLHKLMLLVQYSGALRPQEMLGITFQDINLTKWVKQRNEFQKLGRKQEAIGEIKVHGKGNKEGTAYIQDKYMLFLHQWCSVNQDILTPETKLFDMSIRKWRRLLSEACKRANIKHINPHLLRHARATHLREEGKDALDLKEMLRHTSITSTQIYIHGNAENLKNKLLNNTHENVPQNDSQTHKEVITETSDDKKVIE